jgi:hypothetical protein
VPGVRSRMVAIRNLMSKLTDEELLDITLGAPQRVWAAPAASSARSRRSPGSSTRTS